MKYDIAAYYREFNSIQNSIIQAMHCLIVVSACLAVTFGHNFSRQPSQAVPVQSRNPDQIDDSYEDSEYHYSWLHDGNQEYTSEQAVAYCQGLDGWWHAATNTLMMITKK